MTPPIDPIRHILVALDASSASLAALEGAAMMATRVRAELYGLFVEDENLIRLAGLPFAAEQGVYSAGTQPLGLEQMEQRLRAQAVRAERALSATAQRYACRAEFRVVRGQVVGRLLAAIEKSDLAVLGSVGAAVINRSRLGLTARSAMDRATRPLLLAPPGATAQGPVAVLYDVSAQAGRALELAWRLFKDREDDLTVLVVAQDPQASEELGRAVQVHIEALGGRVRLLTPRETHPEALLAAIRRGRYGTVVLPVDTAALGNELARRLLEEVGCSVLLVARSA